MLMAVLVTQQVLKTTQYHQKPGRLLAKIFAKTTIVPLLCPGLVLQKILRRAQPPPPPPDGAMAAGGVWATGGGEDEEARHRRHCTHTQSFAHRYTVHVAQSSSYAHTLREFLYGEHWG